MSTATRTPMTVARRVVVALLTAFAVMLVLVVIAVVALNRVADAKNQVIHRESRLVIDSYRLDLAVAERGVALRNFLLTGDGQHLDRVERADARYADALAGLETRVYTSEGRRLLEQVREGKAALEEVSSQLIADRAAGTLLPEELPRVVAEQLTPARQALTTVVEQLIEREEQLIDDALRDSDDTARNTVWLMIGLGALGVAMAAAVGAKMTRDVTARLTAVALGIDSAATEILAGTSQQVAVASEQAAAVQQTVATADELAQTAEQSAERSRAVAERSQRSADVAQEGTAAVGESAAAMAEIRGQVEAIGRTIVTLAERGQAISGIVRSVEDIAEQIHLLALNAAIEAARAGEHGRGFSVVAAEVRALADQSKRATVQIADILGDIQQGTNSAVMATEEGSKRVSEGVERVERTGATIDELADTVASAAIAAEQISASSGQQAVATVQISHAMRDLDDATQQSAAATRQAEEAARHLSDAAAELKALVGAP